MAPAIPANIKKMVNMLANSAPKIYRQEKMDAKDTDRKEEKVVEEEKVEVVV